MKPITVQPLETDEKDSQINRGGTLKINTPNNKPVVKKLAFKKISRSIKEEDENSDSESQSGSGSKTSPSIVSRRSEANKTSIANNGVLKGFS